MQNTQPENFETETIETTVYQLRIAGHIAPSWSAWFEQLEITQLADGSTLLTGPIVDQAALFGLLKKVRDLGRPLISVNLLNSKWQALLPGQVDELKGKI